MFFFKLRFFIDVISRKRISFKQRQNVLTSCNDSCPAILDFTASLFWARQKNTCGIRQTPATKKPWVLEKSWVYKKNLSFLINPEFKKEPEFWKKSVFFFSKKLEFWKTNLSIKKTRVLKKNPEFLKKQKKTWVLKKTLSFEKNLFFFFKKKNAFWKKNYRSENKTPNLKIIRFTIQISQNK